MGWSGLDYSGSRSYAPRRSGTTRFTGYTPTRSSRYSPRSFPEAIRLNDENLGNPLMTGIGYAARAPAYVLERPVAFASEFSKRTTGEDHVGNFFKLFQGTVVEDATNKANDLLTFSNNLAPGALNAQTARFLRDTAELPDDAVIPKIDPGHMSTGVLGGVADMFDAAQRFLRGEDVFQGPTWTVGEMRADAYKRGFTPQDISDLKDGKRDLFSFGNLSTNENPLIDVSGRLAMDPLNIALLGAPAIAGVASKAPLLNKVFQGQRAFSQAIRASKSMPMIEGMKALRAGSIEGASLGALGRHLSMLGRGVSDAAQAYRKTAVTLTAGQLAVNALDYIIPDNTPLDNFMEPLFEVGRALEHNTPLSDSNLFNLYAAFSLPVREPASNWWRSTKNDGLRVGIGPLGRQTSILRRTNDIERRVLKVLGGDRKTVFAKFTRGEAGFLDFVMQAARSKFVADGEGHIGVEAIAAASAPEGVLQAENVGRYAEVGTEKAIREGDITGRDVANTIVENAVGPRSFDPQTGKPTTGGVHIDFDPDLEIARWNAYEQQAMSLENIGQQFRFHIGVMDGLLPKEHLQRARMLFQRMAGKDGYVQPEDVQRILEAYPTLTASDTGAGSWFNIAQGPYAKPMHWKAHAKRLDNLMSDAPTMRDYLYDFEKLEQRSERLNKRRGTVFNEHGLPDPDRAPDIGEAGVLVQSARSKLRSDLGMAPQSVAEAAQARSVLRTLEDSAAQTLDESGWNVRSAVQSIDLSEQGARPAVSMRMGSDTDPEALKLAAATVLRDKSADSALVFYSGADALAKNGVEANAVHLRYDFGAVNAEQGELIAATARAIKAEHVDWNYTAGVLHIFLGDEALPSATSRMRQAGLTIEPGVADAWISRIHATKGVTRGRAGELAADVRNRNATDIRSIISRRVGLERRRLAEVESSGQPRPGYVGTPDEARTRGGDLRDVRSEYGGAPETAVDLGGYPDTTPAPIGASRPPGDIVGALRDAHDAATGNQGQVLFLKRADDELADVTPNFAHWTEVRGQPEAEIAKVQALEHFNKMFNPQYRIHSLPTTGTAVLRGQGKAIEYLIRGRRAAGDGTIAAVAGKTADFFHALGGRVYTKQLAESAKQTFYNELLSRMPETMRDDVRPTLTQIDGFLRQLTDTSLSEKVLGQRVARRGDLLSPGKIAEIASGVAKEGRVAAFEGFAPEVLAAIGGAQNMYKLLDKAGSRFYRATREAAQGKGGLGQAIALFHGGQTATSKPSHYIKAWYHLFRFVADPRWHIMNALEADLLGLAKFGTQATRFTGARSFDDAARALHGGGKGAEIDLQLDAIASGTLDPRHLHGYIGRAFREGRISSTRDVLKLIVEEDPGIRNAMQLKVEGIRDIKSTLKSRTGTDDVDSWVNELEQMLYDYDKVGVKETVEQAAKRILNDQDYAAMQPLILELARRNQKIFEDVTNTFHGNTNRSNLERVLNSFFLYWPISYQLKVGKALFDVLTKQAFGMKTNLAGAWYVDRLYDQHVERMATDESYARMFYDNPALWQFAGMMFPITPFDVGVSASRITRYSASRAGSILGLWEYDEAYPDNPVEWAIRIANMGPAYSIDLARTMFRESGDKPKQLPSFSEGKQ